MIRSPAAQWLSYGLAMHVIINYYIALSGIGCLLNNTKTGWRAATIQSSIIGAPK